MAQVQVRDGQSLYVRVLGRGQPVLMLAGLGMHSGHWLPFIWPYLHQYRFYLPDFRGFGRSSHIRLNQADVFHNHAQDVQDIIEYFRLQDFVLAGISLGGSTALHLQREVGFQGVQRYLHIDQSPCVANQADWSHGLFGLQQDELFGQLHGLADVLQPYQYLQQLGELPLSVRRDAARILADVVALMTGKPLLTPLFRQILVSPKQLSRHLPLSQLQDCLAYLRAYSQGSHDYRHSLRQCQTPITVMVGMKSPLYAPAGQMAMADYAPHVKIIRFHRSGHVPLANEPIKFIRELGVFLRG